ncbi:mitotic checkpoint regulator, MAD2B-interacting-domain-containing protein [Syncephalis fuscata]|nr:mitotic checkpoint regulator, MAD2B-interacting-domain-containing protein [Syncephalis fuscata]
MKKDSTQTAASSMGNGGLRSSLSSFLPPPRNRRPMKSTAGLGERAGSNARDWSGTAMGADAHIPDEINGMQQPDDGQDVSGSSTAMPTLNAMIPHSLMKRQQKPSSSTVKSKGKDVEETNLFPLGHAIAIEESESREYSRDSISATIKPITASIDTAEQNTYDASAYQYQEYAYTQGYDMHNVSQTYEDDGQMTLSDEAIAALTGRRKRQHDFGPVNVNIVDVNLADRMSGPGYGGIGNPDKLAQQTAMQMTPIGGGGDKRRRHNIMYLAQQAASREQEFEERAAIGRKNRRETAAKYGFR